MNLIHSKRMGALLALVLAATGCGGGSDSSTTTVTTVPGTITGTVKKGTSVVAGVSVTPSPAASPAVVTGADGKYTINLPPGSYTLAFNGDGVEPATSDSLDVTANHTTSWNQTLATSALVVTVNLPESATEREPVGFGKTVSGITVTAKLNGNTVALGPQDVTWSIRSYDGLSGPPTAATPSPATGTTTSFDVGTFDAVLAGGNAWMSAKYGEQFPYIRVPERAELVSFSTQQVLAMSYMVRATVTSGSHTTTGSAVVSPVSVSNGGNYQPKGLMVVASDSEAESYAWTMQYLAPSAGTPTFGAPPEGTVLTDANRRNPYFVPTATGVYKLQNGASGAPIYFRVSTWHGIGKSAADPGDDGVSCGSCHGLTSHGDYTLAQFDEWAGSAHANHNYKDPFATSMPLVQFELTDTSAGNHYNSSCIECHTVGNNRAPTADNNGFDDVARGAGWTFPATKGPEAWATIANVPGLLHRASIQCENCHGPLEPSEHAQPSQTGFAALFALPISPVASMSAGVCTTCHDDQPYHDRGSLWATSGHADPELVEEAVVENRGTTAAHCGRCHAAEGFKVYAAQQQAGTPGNIAKPTTCTAQSNPYCQCTGTPAVCTVPAAATCTPSAGHAGATDPFDPACPCKPSGKDSNGNPNTTCSGDPFYYAYLNGLGLNKATAHSQTCQTCHDPHKTELRVSGDSKVTAAGFNVRNAGAGALCIVCHNTRIGNARFSDSALSSWTAGHSAAQADVFAGRNTFFYGPASGTAADVLPNESAHKVLADTCVDCHLKIVPADTQAKFGIHTDNHTFTASRQVCTSCHGAGIADVVAKQTDAKLEELATSLALLFQERLNKGVDASTVDNPFTIINTDGSISDTPTSSFVTVGDTAQHKVTKVSLSTVHGAPGLIVTLADNTVFGSSVINFLAGGKAAFGCVTPASSGGPKATDQALTANQVIAAKAVYNYLLIEEGSAHGIHNPSFVNGVLDATLSQVTSISGGI